LRYDPHEATQLLYVCISQPSRRLVRLTCAHPIHETWRAVTEISTWHRTANSPGVANETQFALRDINYTTTLCIPPLN
jgi:hypothetical protein